MPSVFAIFHLNLAYSSLEEEQREAVVRRCYTPVLDMVEEAAIPLGLEMTGWTLQQINSVAPDWVERFARLLGDRRCELVGSGHTQLIGPLVPREVNLWNQRLGRETYRRLLGTVPSIALINELAYSTGLVEVYRQAGFKGVIVDRNNVQLALGEEAVEPLPYAADSDGNALPLLWADSILFQKLQRYVHGDISWDDYFDYLKVQLQKSSHPLPLYCNDAEVFDFRPGRYSDEPELHSDGEWRRMRTLFQAIEAKGLARWQLPSDALPTGTQPGRITPLTSIAHPTPVKKQKKYNITRWALTGRNDLWINTVCHRLTRALNDEQSQHPDDWRRLCEAWSSDLRTHITEQRWLEAKHNIECFASEKGIPSGLYASPQSPPALSRRGISAPWQMQRDQDGIYLAVKSPGIEAEFNLRRGLAVRRLAFARHGLRPLLGTVEHGHFSSIELGADFYSGNTVVELPAEHRRLTDLHRCDPTVWQEDERLSIQARVETDLGPIIKTWTLDPVQETARLEVALPGWTPPHGTVRLATLTLLRRILTDPLTVHCANGGREEMFVLDRTCLHTEPASPLVSSQGGFGATTGQLRIDNGNHGLQLEWDPGRCAAIPMLYHRVASPDALTRIFFSIAELDETRRPEGSLAAFDVTISPY